MSSAGGTGAGEEKDDGRIPVGQLGNWVTSFDSALGMEIANKEILPICQGATEKY